MTRKQLDLSSLDQPRARSGNRLLRDPPNKGAVPPQKGSPKKSYDTKQFRFVPVGFRITDLDFLDQAVFSLRQRGFKQATRSAIIRRLLDQYGRNVVEEYE